MSMSMSMSILQHSRLIIAVIALTFGTLGCTSITRSNLAKTERRDVIVLNEGVSYISPWMHRIEYGALPGSYRAEGEDAKGIYYFGEGRSIWIRNEVLYKDLARLHIGGIYMPKNETDTPQFFYVFEKDVHTAENIENLTVERIASTATASPNIGVGVNVAGAVIGGAIVGAIIESAVGELTMIRETKDPAVIAKIRAAVRPNDKTPAAETARVSATPGE